ncbi:Pds5a [Symbiodinium sp. CCMP2592]|nr:Pds5a [Symbiodinium sp. CCMP2592]
MDIFCTSPPTPVKFWLQKRFTFSCRLHGSRTRFQFRYPGCRGQKHFYLMLSDSDEDSEDFFTVAPSAEDKEPACSEENCEESVVAEPPQDDPEEQVVSRLARLWRQHVSEQSDGGPDLSDRLAASAEYRRWVKEVDVALGPGEAVPSFTELWIELNKRPAVQGRSRSPRSASDPRARFDGWSQERRPRWHSAQEALQLLLDSLSQFEASASGRSITGQELSASMRKHSREFSIQKTPFEKLGKLLQLAAQDGWIRLTWTGDTMSVQILELPTNGVANLADAWEREKDVGIRLEPARPPILREVRRVDRVRHVALKPAPYADPLADNGGPPHLRQRAVARLSASERGKLRPVTPERRSIELRAREVKYPKGVLTRSISLQSTEISFQETEQREALSHALQRLCRSAEFCRDRLSVGKPELRPILDALRPVELDLQEASKVCVLAPTEAGAGSYDVLRQSLQDMQQKCEELSANLRKETEASDVLEQSLAKAQAHVRRLDDQVQAQEAVLELQRKEQAFQAENLVELQRRSRSEAEARERELRLRQEEALKQLTARESRTSALLAEKLQRLQKGLRSAQKSLSGVRSALDNTGAEARLREYLDEMAAAEQKICEKLKLCLRARHSRQAGLESQLSDLHLQTAAQQKRHQQESFQTAQQQALLAAGTADVQARSSRELQRLSSQLQAVSRSVATERAVAVQEQTRRQRQWEVVEVQRRDAEAAQERARHDLQRLRAAVGMARSDLSRQQEALVELRKQTRETQDSLSLAANGNEHLKVQLAEYRAGSQKVLQEEVLTRQAIHEERFLRQQRFYEANLAAARARKGELEKELLLDGRADGKVRSDRILDLAGEMQTLQDEVSSWRSQCNEISGARAVLEDGFAHECGTWSEEMLAGRVSMHKVALQAESLEEELQLVEEKAAATTSQAAARRAEQRQQLETLENQLGEAKAELTKAKQSLAAENETLQRVSAELEQQTCKASLEKTNLEAELWRCRFEGESEQAQLRDKVDAQRREADAYEAHARSSGATEARPLTDDSDAKEMSVRSQGAGVAQNPRGLNGFRSPNGAPDAHLQEGSPAPGNSETATSLAKSQETSLLPAPRIRPCPTAQLQTVLADNERLTLAKQTPEAPGLTTERILTCSARLQTGDTTGLSDPDPETDQAEQVTGRGTLARFRAHASTLGTRLKDVRRTRCEPSSKKKASKAAASKAAASKAASKAAAKKKDHTKVRSREQDAERKVKPRKRGSEDEAPKPEAKQVKRSKAEDAIPLIAGKAKSKARKSAADAPQKEPSEYEYYSYYSDQEEDKSESSSSSESSDASNE